MTIPTSSNFPTTFDSNSNLYEVHDALRVRLAEDYTPGDTSIIIEGDADVITKFPSDGLITLTEQISDIDDRAISFHYSSRTSTTFAGLEILSGFDNDVVKPAKLTNVTQNVMASHHNNIKNAIVAIEEFVGIQGTVDTMPWGETLIGRINFIRNLVLTPRAWFTANKTVGLIPLEVDFTDQSFRLGDGSVTFLWDFGDQNPSFISFTSFNTISVISFVPTNEVNVLVQDVDGGSVTKTYSTPGVYDVTLTVTNEYGQDIVEFKNFIEARIAAPLEADVQFDATTVQNSTLGDTTPLFNRLATAPGGPWTIPPTIRSKINTLVSMEIPIGENPLTPGYSYAGEELSGGVAIDPIVSYTWSLGDDLIHSNSMEARASYGIGGIYDMKLRTDTSFGSYRITTYENVIDIIENRNLWLFTKSGNNVKANEFGLISETFKVATQTRTIVQDDRFLNGTGEETRAKREFNRNVNFTNINTVSSGSSGEGLAVWSSGGNAASALSTQTVEAFKYNGFDDTYTDPGISITRPWNWIFLNSGNLAYFLFGPDPLATPNTNLTNQEKTILNMSTFVDTNETLDASNYLSGADELQENPTDSYTAGEPDTGRFSVYRSAWKGQSGYFLRNDGVGEFFRIRSFYQTSGTLTESVLNITKLPDMTGTTKLEGQLVDMSNGLFFFNNSGNISAYNDSSGVWETGSSATTSFRNLQDSTVSDFDNLENTLLATSDGDRIAYLSYDYSTNAMIKFNGIDLTFTLLSSRPNGEQWAMGVY